MLAQVDMTRKYEQLNAEERDIIAAMKAEGRSMRDIGLEIGRDPATISRELRRNAPPCHKGYYLSHKAHERAINRRYESHKRQRLKDDKIRKYITRLIKTGLSPELAAGRLRRLMPKLSISHEAIYQWIYSDAPGLKPYLLRHHKRRKRRGYSRKHKKSHIPCRVTIDERPASIELRKEMGHWEADTAVSRQSLAALHIMAERKSRFTKLSKLDRKEARLVRIVMNRRLCKLPKTMRRTFTYDNGSENVEHVLVNKRLGSKSYFCRPYRSWEKGTVENTIGLIRRFLPKKTNFASVSKSEIKYIENWLNNRPRKCLDYATPAEVFYARVALAG